MRKSLFTTDGIHIITKEVIEQQRKEVEESIKKGNFKDKSNEMISVIAQENPEFFKEAVAETLESDKPEEFKKGYLSGVVTFYDLLRRQGRNIK